MIEISLGKMVLLALIALIVLGPEKLPGAARTAGALLRRVRSGWENVRSEVERELEIEEIKRNAREAAAQAEAAQNAMKDALNEAREPLDEAAVMMKQAASLEAGSDTAAVASTVAELDDAMQAELPLGQPSTKADTESPSIGGRPHGDA